MLDVATRSGATEMVYEAFSMDPDGKYRKDRGLVSVFTGGEALKFTIGRGHTNKADSSRVVTSHVLAQASGMAAFVSQPARCV